MGKRPARNITAADREAAARLKSLWLAIPKERRPTQQALADAFPGDANQSLISQYMTGKIALNFRAVRFFARQLGCPESAIRHDLPEQLAGAVNHSTHAPTDPKQSDKGSSPSHPSLPDRSILHETLTLLAYDRLQAGEYTAQAETDRFLELWTRVAADGGRLTKQHNDDFVREVEARRGEHAEPQAARPATGPARRIGRR